jgi:soluble lytic murein transglycosylase
MLKFYKIILITILVLGSSQQAVAFFEESTFKKAHEAFEKKNVVVLADYVKKLTDNHYLLAPYAQYWLMNLRIDELGYDEIQQFIAQHNDYAFANTLRDILLKKMARNKDWSAFLAVSAHYQSTDKGITCLTQYAKSQLGEPVDARIIRGLYLVSKQQPSDCNLLFDEMMRRNVITSEHRFQRLRLALMTNQIGLAKAIAMQFPYIDTKTANLIDKAKQSSEKFLTRGVASYKTPFGVELNLFALNRLAISDVDKASLTLKVIQDRFSQANRKTAWQIVAFQAAKDLDPNALAFYELASNAVPTPDDLQDEDWYVDQNDWKVRAALRAENWSVVMDSINEMPASQSQSAKWRYWKARALIALNKDRTEANALLVDLSKERHYYGWLAADEINATDNDRFDISIESTTAEMKAIADMPPVQRAVALLKFDLRWDAKKEWALGMQGLDDHALIAAASYAQKIGWFDVSINTADSTREAHNFKLRYPTPYRDYFLHAANDEQLDEAWLFGLVRQESRFMDYAKSVVGASGLMQLMPNTARWIAKQKGIREFNGKDIHDVKTNIALGSFYMRHTLDLMSGKAVMATAAYNAGPSRAFKWQANKPLEGAIYIETIPFDETRNYVQRVMANAHIYAPQLGMKTQTLKDRIGTIPPKK